LRREVHVIIVNSHGCELRTSHAHKALGQMPHFIVMISGSLSLWHGTSWN